LELVAVPSLSNLVQVTIDEHHRFAIRFFSKILEERSDMSASAAAFSAQLDNDRFRFCGIEEASVLRLGLRLVQLIFARWPIRFARPIITATIITAIIIAAIIYRETMISNKGSDLVLISANISSNLLIIDENDKGRNVLELVAVPSLSNLVQVTIDEHHRFAIRFFSKILEEGSNMHASATAFSAQLDNDRF